MRWFAIHHELATNAKWLDLSMDERGAWISLLVIAAGQEDRGTLPNRTTAEALLRREMRQVSRPPADLVATLIDGRWIDEDDSGQLIFHDFEEWQLRIRKPSDWPEAIGARVAKSRAKAKAKGDRELDRELEVTPGNALQGEPTPADYLGTTNLYRVFEGLTGVAPTSKDRKSLDDLVRTWDRATIRTAMLADPEPKRNPDKLIGRAYFRLKEGMAS